MPTFCRHNRLIQNCSICAREQAIEARPVLSSSAPRISQPRPGREAAPSTRRREPASRSGGGSTAVRVQRLAREAEDGYSCALVPGVRSSADADRLAEEIAFATARLIALEHDPPGLYGEVARRDQDVEERTWLAFQIAYLCPLDGDAPFAAIAAARTSWSSGEVPSLATTPRGSRAAEPGRGGDAATAYRGWAARSGSQAAAVTGEESWSAERRFDRVFERLALPGFHRDPRFELLVTLGRLGLYELRAGSLQLGGADEVTVAAKRVFGIGDRLLLERRAAELAAACGVPLESLDLALFNWGRRTRSTIGVPYAGSESPPEREAIRAALGLSSG